MFIINKENDQHKRNYYTKRNSVCCQINRTSAITFQIFRKDFYVYSLNIFTHVCILFATEPVDAALPHDAATGALLPVPLLRLSGRYVEGLLRTGRGTLNCSS